mmetsp:Transcript_5561/g.11832  ORF Transcript_5561/g.11832 Transcript_5561/m.11832 type:complete len:129 (-) Transcript_5561:175-561(-)
MHHFRGQVSMRFRLRHERLLVRKLTSIGNEPHGIETNRSTCYMDPLTLRDSKMIPYRSRGFQSCLSSQLSLHSSSNAADQWFPNQTVFFVIYSSDIETTFFATVSYRFSAYIFALGHPGSNRKEPTIK